MKKISEHLGELIVALAGVLLLVSVIVYFNAPIGDFFHRIIHKEVTVGDKIVNDINPGDLIFTEPVKDPSSTEPPNTDPPSTEPPSTEPPITEHTHLFDDWRKVDNIDHSRACVCGEIEIEAHSFSFVENGDGTKTGTCSKCNHSITVESDAHVCLFGEWSDNGDGQHIRSCSCGAVDTEAHNYTRGEGDGESSHGLYCTVCDFYDWEDCSFSGGADMGDGTHIVYCDYCSNSYIEPHSLRCYAGGGGYHWADCLVCGYNEKESCSVDWISNGDGTHSGDCDSCGRSYGPEDCSFSAWSDNGDGTHSRSCTYCGYSETGDCSTNAEGKCSDCGAVTHTHSFGAWKTVVEPTCLTRGKSARSCACGSTEEKDLGYGDCDYSAHCGTEHTLNIAWGPCEGGNGQGHAWDTGYCCVCIYCGSVYEYETWYWCTLPAHWANPPEYNGDIPVSHN